MVEQRPARGGLIALISLCHGIITCVHDSSEKLLDKQTFDRQHRCYEGSPVGGRPRLTNESL